MQKEKTYQAIGEIILLMPLIIFSFLIGYGKQIMVIMFSLLTFKQFYKFNYHTTKPDNWKWNWSCTLLTYSLFIFILVFTYSYKNEISLMVLTVSAIAYANAKLGNFKYCQKRFKVDIASESETRKRCQEKGFKTYKIEECIDLFCRLNQAEFADKYKIELQSVANKKMRWRKKLND